MIKRIKEGVATAAIIVGGAVWLYRQSRRSIARAAADAERAAAAAARPRRPAASPFAGGTITIHYNRAWQHTGKGWGGVPAGYITFRSRGQKPGKAVINAAKQINGAGYAEGWYVPFTLAKEGRSQDYVGHRVRHKLQAATGKRGDFQAVNVYIKASA